MSEKKIVMRNGRVCPVCKRDGTNGQSVVQVHQVDSDTLACPECGTRFENGEVYVEEPAGPKKGKK